MLDLPDPELEKALLARHYHAYISYCVMVLPLYREMGRLHRDGVVCPNGNSWYWTDVVRMGAYHECAAALGKIASKYFPENSIDISKAGPNEEQRENEPGQ